MLIDALSSQGFVAVPGLLTHGECGDITAGIAGDVATSVGTRCLLSLDWCRALAARLRIEPKLAPLLPGDYVASQCTYFAKSAARNWLVPIHQDLSIPVAELVEAPELHGWSRKEGELFVQPPVALLERLVAVRLHLDPCGPDDGPLQVVPGSHVRGRVELEAAAELRRSEEVVSCTAGRGDALVMRPLLLHASSKAKGSSMRRVLHFLFGPRDLPHGLRWQRAV